jgi:hypothetical protein
MFLFMLIDDCLNESDYCALFQAFVRVVPLDQYALIFALINEIVNVPAAASTAAAH